MAKRVRAYRPAVVILACLPVLLASCAPPTPGNSTQNSAVVGPAIAPKSSTGGIRFMVWGSAPQLQAYQALVALYEQRNPNQPVELIAVPNPSDYQKRLAADLAAGAPADVVVLSSVNLASLATRGLLAPVAPYLAASRSLKTDDFYAEALDPFYYNRQLLCLPQNASGLVVYYNKDLFQQAGLRAPQDNWTWDDLLSDARTLTRDTHGDGRPGQYGLGFEPTLANLAPLIWQRQGLLVEGDNWPKQLALNSRVALTATTWLVSLQTEYHVEPDSRAELAASSQQRFTDGSLAMYINTRVGVPAYRQITSFDWDVAPLPARNGQRQNVLFADGYCLAAGSGNKAAAWQFVEFAASPDGEAVLARSGAFVPALASVARSAAFLDPGAKPAHSQVFTDTVPQSAALPALENWSDIQAIADEELGQAFYGQKDVAQALAAAVMRSEEYFKIHTAH